MSHKGTDVFRQVLMHRLFVLKCQQFVEKKYSMNMFRSPLCIYVHQCTYYQEMCFFFKYNIVSLYPKLNNSNCIYRII